MNYWTIKYILKHLCKYFNHSYKSAFSSQLSPAAANFLNRLPMIFWRQRKMAMMAKQQISKATLTQVMDRRPTNPADKIFTNIITLLQEISESISAWSPKFWILQSSFQNSEILLWILEEWYLAINANRVLTARMRLSPSNVVNENTFMTCWIAMIFLSFFHSSNFFLVILGGLLVLTPVGLSLPTHVVL